MGAVLAAAAAFHSPVLDTFSKLRQTPLSWYRYTLIQLRQQNAQIGLSPFALTKATYQYLFLVSDSLMSLQWRILNPTNLQHIDALELFAPLILTSRNSVPARLDACLSLFLWDDVPQLLLEDLMIIVNLVMEGMAKLTATTPLSMQHRMSLAYALYHEALKLQSGLQGSNQPLSHVNQPIHGVHLLRIVLHQQEFTDRLEFLSSATPGPVPQALLTPLTLSQSHQSTSSSSSLHSSTTSSSSSQQPSILSRPQSAAAKTNPHNFHASALLGFMPSSATPADRRRLREQHEREQQQVAQKLERQRARTLQAQHPWLGDSPVSAAHGDAYISTLASSYSKPPPVIPDGNLLFDGSFVEHYEPFFQVQMLMPQQPNMLAISSTRSFQSMPVQLQAQQQQQQPLIRQLAAQQQVQQTQQLQLQLQQQARLQQENQRSHQATQLQHMQFQMEQQATLLAQHSTPMEHIDPATVFTPLRNSSSSPDSPSVTATSTRSQIAPAAVPNESFASTIASLKAMQQRHREALQYTPRSPLAQSVLSESVLDANSHRRPAALSVASPMGSEAGSPSFHNAVTSPAAAAPLSLGQSPSSFSSTHFRSTMSYPAPPRREIPPASRPILSPRSSLLNVAAASAVTDAQRDIIESYKAMAAKLDKLKSYRSTRLEQQKQRNLDLQQSRASPTSSSVQNVPEQKESSSSPAPITQTFQWSPVKESHPSSPDSASSPDAIPTKEIASTATTSLSSDTHQSLSLLEQIAAASTEIEEDGEDVEYEEEEVEEEVEVEEEEEAAGDAGVEEPVTEAEVEIVQEVPQELEMMQAQSKDGPVASSNVAASVESVSESPFELDDSDPFDFLLQKQRNEEGVSLADRDRGVQASTQAPVAAAAEVKAPSSMTSSTQPWSWSDAAELQPDDEPQRITVIGKSVQPSRPLGKASSMTRTDSNTSSSRHADDTAPFPIQFDLDELSAAFDLSSTLAPPAKQSHGSSSHATNAAISSKSKVDEPFELNLDFADEADDILKELEFE